MRFDYRPEYRSEMGGLLCHILKPLGRGELFFWGRRGVRVTPFGWVLRLGNKLSGGGRQISWRTILGMASLVF